MPSLQPEFRRACEALVNRALRDLAADGSPPQFAPVIHDLAWSRVGQEQFALNAVPQWHPPSFWWGPWLEDLPEMKTLRSVVQQVPAIAGKVDTLVGAAGHATLRQLSGLIRGLIRELVTEARSWEPAEGAFDGAYARLEAGLTQDTATYIDFVPLLGLDGATR